MNAPSIDLQALRKSGQFRPSPLERDGVEVVRLGAARPSPVNYFVYRDVLEELVFAANYSDSNSFAVLTGGFGVGNGVGFVEVSGFENLVYPEGEVDLVETFLETVRRVDRLPENEVIVGLFCGAPGSGAIIPEAAAHLHLSLFNIPFQPLVVVDAETDTMAVYGRAPRRTFVDAPLFVVAPESQSEADSA